jgi:calcineurin-like phosphoesterase family protein
MIYFTSDTHLDHKNIIKYCARPFKDVDEMNDEIIRRWNSVVTKDDTVYHLGDFALTDNKKLHHFVSRLNGLKILVLGNHDRSKEKMLDAGFDMVFGDLRIETHQNSHVMMMLHHRPLQKKEWNNSKFLLCGHVHEKWRRKGNMINVGVDVWDFTPRTFDELMAAKDEGWFKPGEEMR